MTKKEKIIGGELTDYPNDQYRKFFDKFNEIETLSSSSWKTVHIAAYFCKKYKEAYNVDYKFKFNSPSPNKCFEVFVIKKIAMLLTSDPAALKDYIDWVFVTKVANGKRRLTSISFLSSEGLINDYKFGVLLVNKKDLNISRSTSLPEKYKDVFKSINVQISTYGDLAFLYQMEPKSNDIQLSINKILELGFDKEIINRII